MFLLKKAISYSKLASHTFRRRLSGNCDRSNGRHRRRARHRQDRPRPADDRHGGAAGQDVVAAVKLYMTQHGDTVAGKKIELIIRDDGSIPDNAKRLAQELVVNDNVAILGAGTTPSAMSMAPISTEAKIPTVVMISGTSVVTERSPYYVRTCFTLGQQSGIIADWAIKNGSKKAVSVLSDLAPGAEAGKAFEQHFTQAAAKSSRR